MDDKYECSGCTKEIIGLFNLLDHKINDCDEVPICTTCQTNLGEYHVLQYLRHYLEQPKSKPIIKHVDPLKMFFDDLIEETTDPYNKGLTIKSIWESYVQSKEYFKMGVIKKDIKKYIVDHGYPLKQGSFNGKHQRYLFNTLKWKD